MAEVVEPSTPAGELLLKVDAVGICGSELSGYLGQNSLRKPPLIMGHEFSATVAEIGAEVSGFAVGDRVTVNPMVPDSTCVLCRNGYENLCLHRTLIGAHRPGAFADYVTAPAKAVYKLPDAIDDIGGTLVEPLACALRAIEHAHVSPGSRILVQGAGPIGLLVVRAAKAAGASTIAVTDVVEQRLAQAQAWGATDVFTPIGNDIPAAMKALTEGLGVDAAIDAVGLPVTRQTAINAVRPGGRVVFTGLHEDDTSIPGNSIVRSEITIQGAFCYSQANFAAAIRLVASGLIPPAEEWISIRPLEAADRSFAQLIDDPAAATKIVLRP
jgi:threonine dehydrogenase-like Zn-dependent dehydrogenase